MIMGDLIIRFALNVIVFFWTYQVVWTLWHVIPPLIMEKLNRVHS